MKATRNKTGVLFRAAVACTVAATVLLGGCSQSDTKEPVVTVQAARAQRTSIDRVVEAEGVLYPLQGAVLTPKISAPVRRFLVNKGSKVRRGQLLAVLENQDLAAAEMESKGAYEQAQATYETTTQAGVPEAMKKAEADLQQAQQAYEAQQKVYASREQLYKEGALPRKELDQAGVALTEARNQYELARQHLAALQAGGKQQQLRAASGELAAAKGKYLGAAAQLGYSEIRSPIDGVVTERPLYPGQMAAAGEPLITVMDLSQVICRIHLPQEEAALLKVGDAATLTAGTEEGVPAKVTLVSPAVDPGSTTIEVWVQAANKDNKLRPGTSARIAIVAEHVAGAVVVPAAALLSSEGATSVMVVSADGRAHQRSVQAGIRHDSEVQITAGLQAGERVVTTGAYGLPDNTRVKVEEPGNAQGGAGKTDSTDPDHQ
ncbi:MAG TPA: efflux RND transporter periplasmic adaptor subunit [Terriglobales bacterium]|nr:efflux RND transporter periplasmic adaptor subunit [Terriglobales bacterium]